jgi:hypothetical protein
MWGAIALVLALGLGACGSVTTPLGPVTMTRVSATATVPAGSDGAATATCAGGDQLVSGGYAITPTSYVPTASFPSSAQQWTVEASAGGTDPLTVTAYANCLRAAFSIGAAIVTDTLAYPAGLSSGPAVDCPSGTTITGGGFKVSTAGTLIESTFPAFFGGASPYFTFADVAPGPGTAETFAICANTAAIVTTVVDNRVSVSSGAATHLAVGCPAGQLLVGGGFGAASDPNQRPYYHFADTAEASFAHWTTDVNYQPSSPLDITVSAACASFPAQGGTVTPPTVTPIAITRYEHTVTGTDHPLTASASCPGAEQLLGGGFSTGRSFVDASYPSAPGTWTVRLDNTNGVAQTLTAVVVCLRAPFAIGTSIQTAAAAVPLGPPTHAVAACPAGSVATGGGFDTTLTDRPDGTSVSGAVITSKPTASGWDTANFTATATSETAYAVCAGAHVTLAPPATTNLMLAVGATGTGTATCPSGQMLIGGGWDEMVGYGSGILANDLTTDLARWEVTPHEGFGVPLTTAIYGICATIA